MEEGIVAGGGSTLLKLAQKVDEIVATLDNDEQKVGAEIVRRALSYPLKLIANNAGVNGSVVVQKVSLDPYLILQAYLWILLVCHSTRCIFTCLIALQTLVFRVGSKFYGVVLAYQECISRYARIVLDTKSNKPWRALQIS